MEELNILQDKEFEALLEYDSAEDFPDTDR
jgi:hypothetical protein